MVYVVGELVVELEVELQIKKRGDSHHSEKYFLQAPKREILQNVHTYIYIYKETM